MQSNKRLKTIKQNQLQKNRHICWKINIKGIAKKRYSKKTDMDKKLETNEYIKNSFLIFNILLGLQCLQLPVNITNIKYLLLTSL